MVALTTASILVSLFLVILTIILFQLIRRLKQSLDRIDALISQGLVTSQVVHETVVDLVSKLEGVAAVLSVATLKQIVQSILGRKEHHESTK